MATVLDVVNSALKEIRVLAGGETATADDSADGLVTLNDLLDQWGAEKLQIYTTTRTTWTITASTGQYNVGSGEVVNIVRPVFVDHVNYQDTSQSPTLESPLGKLTEDGWAGIRLKTLTSSLPTKYYYNPTYANATVDLWPVPTSTTLQGVLYAGTAVAAFAALTTTVALPPGYKRMIVKSLALEMAPSYGAPLNPVLVAQAREAKAVVKRANQRLTDLTFDRAALIGHSGTGRYSIKAG